MPIIENCADWMSKRSEEQIEIYRNKNATYGDSFGKSVDKYGFISALTRMSDKFNRLENLILGAENKVLDESLQDTLVDLSNYCLMTAYEIEKRK